MNKNIYILCNPVQTGKSTALLFWSKQLKSVGGFITPDVDGLRMLYNIATKNYHSFQVYERTNVDDIEIGRFIFSKDGFDRGKSILKKVMETPPEWTIVDELGKLEMKNEGFGPILAKLILHFQKKTDKKLLLVIRDFLLEDAIARYKLEGCHILSMEELPVLE
ncbi:MAG: nucleoside-triphosphatase [Aurantibacter sp.]